MVDQEVANGKAIVESLLREHASAQGIAVDRLEWGPDGDWVRLGHCELACEMKGRRMVGEFSREDLSDVASSPGVRRRLAQYIATWLESPEETKTFGFRPSP